MITCARIREASSTKGEGRMAHVVRAWRASRMMRWFVVLALLGTATQRVMSRESGLVQDGARQTKLIGSERLVSVEPLAGVGGEICEQVPAGGEAGREETLMAALQQREDARAASIAARSPASQDRSKLKPVRWIHDPYAA